MSNENKTVFISYRTKVSQDLAKWIFDKLRDREYDPFLTTETLHSGRWATQIPMAIKAKAHFLVLLTHETLYEDERPDDWVKKEIELALDYNRNIIPVTIDCFTIDDAKPRLHGNLIKLADFQASPIYREYREAGIEKLCKQFLSKTDYGDLTEIPSELKDEIDKIVGNVISMPTPSDEKLDIEALYNRAVGRSIAGKLETALVDFTEVVNLDPENVGALSNRGKIYFRLGKYQDALNDFQQARSFFLIRNDDSSEMFVLIATTEYAIGQIQKAKDAMRDFLPNDRRYENAIWIGKEFSWHESLVESARNLIASLESG